MTVSHEPTFNNRLNAGADCEKYGALSVGPRRLVECNRLPIENTGAVGDNAIYFAPRLWRIGAQELGIFSAAECAQT